MKAAIAGATGFIGQHLLNLLKTDSTFTDVSVLTRRDIDLSPKFKILIGNISEIEIPITDVAFCALGTTIATAGSKEAFCHVDYNLVIEFAKKAKASGAQTFVLVSSVGADPKSGTFYLKVKGQTEEDLKQIGFESLIILRPSMLLGNRKEFRLGELIGKGAMTILNPLMVGGLTKYKGIKGETVARAMLRLGQEELNGVHILEFDKLQSFS
jgi:uncharacterized protein YbjT (DUF2867 family)